MAKIDDESAWLDDRCAIVVKRDAKSRAPHTVFGVLVVAGSLRAARGLRPCS
ncbi:MAG: hypothetical protein ACLP1X_15520 [Polyangiaceae bacterium]|jgi:hypothetical protein